MQTLSWIHDFPKITLNTLECSSAPESNRARRPFQPFRLPHVNGYSRALLLERLYTSSYYQVTLFRTLPLTTPPQHVRFVRTNFPPTTPEEACMVMREYRTTHQDNVSGTKETTKINVFRRRPTAAATVAFVHLLVCLFCHFCCCCQIFRIKGCE